MRIGRQVARMGSLSCSLILSGIPMIISYFTFELGSIFLSPVSHYTPPVSFWEFWQPAHEDRIRLQGSSTGRDQMTSKSTNFPYIIHLSPQGYFHKVTQITLGNHQCNPVKSNIMSGLNRLGYLGYTNLYLSNIMSLYRKNTSLCNPLNLCNPLARDSSRGKKHGKKDLVQLICFYTLSVKNT